MREVPSYYAIIPADVRYSAIPPNAKLLYGEITALCNKEGFCWATNKYFADLYGVKPKRVSEWVSILAKHGFVKVEIKDLTERKIFLTTIPKIKAPPPEKKDTPLAKNKEHNNTYNNTVNSKSDADVTTPSDKSIWFFESMQKQPLPEEVKIMLMRIVEKTQLEKGIVWKEVKDFVAYWTEKSKNGTKQRWQLQQTFEVDRRLNTWFSNGNKFAGIKKTITNTQARGFTPNIK